MPVNPSHSRFATALRRARESAGLTQAELADRAGLGVRTVSNLERGINTSPYPSTVRLLADALNLPAAARDGLMSAAGRGAEKHGIPVTGGFLGAAPVGHLVARDAERLAITSALAAASGGRSGVVLLTGEPGIGKTRLAQEASMYATERGFLVVSGRCHEPQRETPFVPLFEAFGALCRAAPASVRDGLVDRWPPLVTLLPDQFPNHEPSVWTSPDAAQILYRAATGLVREVAALQPVAILLDDLHWADAATVDLLAHLVRHTATDRLLLLGTYRDAEVDSTHPVRGLAHALYRERQIQAITVDRFDRDTTARLVAQQLDGSDVADSLSDLVHSHSGGNPFFAAEIVTSLGERGDLIQVAGAWTCRPDVSVDAPAGVREVVNERFSRLSSTARDVLEAASVLGAVFDVDDVAILDDEDDRLEAALDDAVRSGLLAIDDGRYAFDHSLTQQALYTGLSPARRKRLHRLIGDRLERRPHVVRRRRSAEIARHLEAGGLLDRAIPFVVLAGEVAAGVYAQDEAIRLYGHAVDLAEEVGDEESAATALDHVGQVELAVARYDDAVHHLVQAADIYQRIGAVDRRLRVEGMIAEALHRRGEGEAAAVRLDAFVAELEEAGGDDQTDGGAALATGLARVRLSLGQHEHSVQAAERAGRLARKEGSVAVEADSNAVRGTSLLFLDRPDDAVEVLERGIALAASIDAPFVESGATLGLQWAVTMHGEFDRARALGERGLEITRRAGNTDLESLHAANLGLTHFYSGDWDEAQSQLERSVELARSGSPTLFSGIPPVYLGVLRAGQGDAVAATACYDEAAMAPDLQTFAFAGYLEARRSELDLRAGDGSTALSRLEPWLSEEAPTRIHDVMLFVAAAEACLALGDADRAELLVGRALRRAEATRNLVDGVDARRLQGRCDRLRGRAAQARTWLEEAFALAVAVGFPAGEQRVRAELGH